MTGLPVAWESALGEGLLYIICGFKNEAEREKMWSEERQRRQAQKALEKLIDSGKALTGWCLAFNSESDLIFLKTEGYKMGYFEAHSGPGGGHLQLTPIAVKSRESDYQFMVLTEGSGSFDHDQMVEYARRWSGYLVEGDEKAYYIGVINAARKALGLAAI